MCGIAGIISFNDNPGPFCGSIQAMSRTMRRRGPDGEGFLLAYSSPTLPAIPLRSDNTPVLEGDLPFFPRHDITTFNERKADVFLAHRRLSIIDLTSSGHQPMSTEDGRFWIIYNGEIYNHSEIRAQLETEGETFFSTSDTEVLLKAYRKWGAECLKRFNGMFAFLIWDDEEKVAFCARDRIGIKPFYYTINNDRFIFASDIRTIIASKLYSPAPDIEGLFHALSFGVAPRPLTAFKDVVSLKQAHWMKIDLSGRVQTDRYWSIPTNVQKHDMNEGEALSLLQEYLEDSIGLRLVSDVPVGTFMSGGIDSTTVSAIASIKHPGIKAFTLAFQSDSELNEVEQARATASMYDMDHIVQNVEDDQILQHLMDIARCYEEPFYDISPNYLVSKLVADNNVTVVLNGLGGDELFGGYPYYNWESRWKLLQKSRYLLWIASLFPCIGHLSDRLHRISCTDTADRFAVAVRSFITDREKRALFLDSRVKEFDTVERIHELYVERDREFGSFLEAISYIDILNYIGNHHVYRVDKFTMNFSLEGRLPFLDHRLVEAAFTIPDRFKIKDGSQKYVLREVAKKFIHKSCIEARKKGFDLPTDRWMRGGLEDFVNGKLHSLCTRGIFSPEAVWRIYRQWRMRCRSFRSVWELVSVEMWFELFMD